MDIRVGFGYDVHKWSDDRPLILGGVTIPHVMGLYGHSDADVLLHAITDALLGALALGDIGTHFPDTDPARSLRPPPSSLEEEPSSSWPKPSARFTTR